MTFPSAHKVISVLSTTGILNKWMYIAAKQPGNWIIRNIIYTGSASLYGSPATVYLVGVNSLPLSSLINFPYLFRNEKRIIKIHKKKLTIRFGNFDNLLPPEDYCACLLKTIYCAILFLTGFLVVSFIWSRIVLTGAFGFPSRLQSPFFSNGCSDKILLFSFDETLWSGWECYPDTPNIIHTSLSRFILASSVFMQNFFGSFFFIFMLSLKMELLWGMSSLI